MFACCHIGIATSLVCSYELTREFEQQETKTSVVNGYDSPLSQDTSDHCAVDLIVCVCSWVFEIPDQEKECNKHAAKEVERQLYQRMSIFPRLQNQTLATRNACVLGHGISLYKYSLLLLNPQKVAQTRRGVLRTLASQAITEVEYKLSHLCGQREDFGPVHLFWMK